MQDILRRCLLPGVSSVHEEAGLHSLYMRSRKGSIHSCGFRIIPMYLAFTMLELLVVISIIALLVSMLLPAL